MSPPVHISFDLHKLGWKAFEDLAACIFRDVLGQTIQVFADGPDGGRDGAFNGKWKDIKDSKSTTFSGNFTIQCKHTSDASKSFPITLIKDEVPKIKRLAKDGLCDVYFFVTNYSIPGETAKQMEKEFVNAGAKKAKVYGNKYINSIISENSTLRRLVPRIYGLGDLTQIVTHQAFRQTIEVLDSIAPDLNCFVPTDAYRKSAHALKKHGFVLLIGEPASGKTMIANLLALSAADEWKLQTIMLSCPEEFSKNWNPDDPGQFFWVDDAFGANQYDHSRVHEWNQRLLKLKTAIHKGARVVFTSRDYIFNSAKKHLKTSSFELFEDSNVVIEVEKLTVTEKQMILYNHLKCGDQTPKFRKSIKPFLVEASETPKFLPEIARRFGSSRFTKELTPLRKPILNFFDKPMIWLKEVIGGLSTSDSAAIALVFIEGGRLKAPINKTELITQTLDSLGAKLGNVKISLKKLEGAFLRFDKENQEWCFRHPTIRDAFASIIGENQEFISIYLAGVRTEQLIEEVTCGYADIEGAKITIPESFFDIVIHKLREYYNKKKYWLNPVGRFLAYRCSAIFLKQYYPNDEELLELARNITSISWLSEEIAILNKLHENGLLPDNIRCEAVARIKDASIKETSINFLEKRIVGSLLTNNEKESHKHNLKDYIFSKWEVLIDDIRMDWDMESDPHNEFDEFRSTLKHISENSIDEDKQNAIEILEVIDNTIVSMEDEMNPEETEYDALEAEATNHVKSTSNRCIFDDVDL